MILHVNSQADAPNGKVRVQFMALTPVPVTTPPTPSSPVYPGFAVIGQLSVQLPAADAAQFTRGAEFELIAKQ